MFQSELEKFFGEINFSRIQAENKVKGFFDAQMKMINFDLKITEKEVFHNGTRFNTMINFHLTTPDLSFSFVRNHVEHHLKSDDIKIYIGNQIYKAHHLVELNIGNQSKLRNKMTEIKMKIAEIARLAQYEKNKEENSKGINSAFSKFL